MHRARQIDLLADTERILEMDHQELARRARQEAVDRFHRGRIIDSGTVGYRQRRLLQGVDQQVAVATAAFLVLSVSLFAVIEADAELEREIGCAPIARQGGQVVGADGHERLSRIGVGLTKSAVGLALKIEQAIGEDRGICELLAQALR